ncbi:MAG: hypothetical protein AAFP69_15980, partial [Planctomycetota bacterium]
RPRISRRLTASSRLQWWGYVGGSLGGGSWDTELAGVQQEISLAEYRLNAGLHRVSKTGGEFHVEIGWAFGREIENERLDTVTSYDDGLYIAGGWQF